MMNFVGLDLAFADQDLVSNPGEGMNVYKCIVPFRQGGTLNSCQAASPLVKLVGGEEKDLELEVNEDDIEELTMGHEDELTTELQEILNEEHQETHRNVSPSEQEEDERG
ncbi:hypothetical protein TNCV_4838161 [Trichonephila clavipes]|nr:hypothetical protein TNCV_4838161 [Trichonephila clavipes]